MNISMIRWHAVKVNESQYQAWKKLGTKTLGLKLLMEWPDIMMFDLPDGSIFEVYGPKAKHPAYFFDRNEVVIGFRVDDIERASAELESTGCELLGKIVEFKGYKYRHFRGPDGRTYGLNSGEMRL